MSTQDSPLFHIMSSISVALTSGCVYYNLFFCLFFFNEEIVQGLHKIKNYYDAVICWYSLEGCFVLHEDNNLLGLLS